LSAGDSGIDLVAAYSNALVTGVSPTAYMQPTNVLPGNRYFINTHTKCQSSTDGSGSTSIHDRSVLVDNVLSTNVQKYGEGNTGLLYSLYASLNRYDLSSQLIPAIASATSTSTSTTTPPSAVPTLPSCIPVSVYIDGTNTSYTSAWVTNPDYGQIDKQAIEGFMGDISTIPVNASPAQIKEYTSGSVNSLNEGNATLNKSILRNQYTIKYSTANYTNQQLFDVLLNYVPIGATAPIPFSTVQSFIIQFFDSSSALVDSSGNPIPNPIPIPEYISDLTAQSSNAASLTSFLASSPEYVPPSLETQLTTLNAELVTANQKFIQDGGAAVNNTSASYIGYGGSNYNYEQIQADQAVIDSLNAQIANVNSEIAAYQNQIVMELNAIRPQIINEFLALDYPTIFGATESFAIFIPSTTPTPPPNAAGRFVVWIVWVLLFLLFLLFLFSVVV